MVGRDVEPDRDIGAEAIEQLELVGRELQHIEAARPERREIERAAADIAADLAAPPGLDEDMADQGRRRRFAVGAGDADETRLGLGAGQQLDVADDLLAGRARRRGDRMRLGQVAGMPGLMMRAVTRDQSMAAGSTTGAPIPAAASREAALSSQATQSMPAAPQGTHRRQAGAREPQHDERRTLEAQRDRSSGHRSFRVARPAIARMAAMIQKRKTMVGSAQPFCSK